MSKRKVYVYECVRDVDVPWIGHDRREERWVDGVPVQCLHVIRLEAKVMPDGMRRMRKYGDFIGTDRPVGKNYTEAVRKAVSRPILNMREGVTSRRVMRPKVSLPKLKLWPEGEVTEKIMNLVLIPGEEDDEGRSRFGRGAHWGPALFEDAVQDVTLPPEAMAMIAITQAAREGVDPSEMDLHAPVGGRLLTTDRDGAA